jgi:DNA-directed RNA polymerase subunit RPC12/RpoP
MVYYCRDCSYSGSKRSDDGYCPACGSARIVLQGKTSDAEKPAHRKRPLVLAGLLWVYLIAHVSWKLAN